MLSYKNLSFSFDKFDTICRERGSFLDICHFCIIKWNKYFLIAYETYVALSSFHFDIYEHRRSGKLGNHGKGATLIKGPVLARGIKMGCTPFFQDLVTIFRDPVWLILSFQFLRSIPAFCFLFLPAKSFFAGKSAKTQDAHQPPGALLHLFFSGHMIIFKLILTTSRLILKNFRATEYWLWV